MKHLPVIIQTMNWNVTKKPLKNVIVDFENNNQYNTSEAYQCSNNHFWFRHNDHFLPDSLSRGFQGFSYLFYISSIELCQIVIYNLN